MHTYVRMYVYYSNDFDLCKIRVMPNLQEWNDCITWGTPVMVIIYNLNVFIYIYLKRETS